MFKKLISYLAGLFSLALMLGLITSLVIFSKFVEKNCTEGIFCAIARWVTHTI